MLVNLCKDKGIRFIPKIITAFSFAFCRKIRIFFGKV